MKTLKNKKLIISYITLGLVFILMGSSNNNPSNVYGENIQAHIFQKWYILLFNHNINNACLL